jgi:DNA polymerase-3 subunit delta
MIIKHTEISRNFDKKINFYLLYGVNTGIIDEVSNNIINYKNSKNIFNYDEDEIISNIDGFKDSILNKSFFEDDRLVIINRGSDKILWIIEDLILKKITDVTILIKANSLEKRSKLRIFFEKNKEALCIPFYEDDHRTLITMAQKFFLEKKIKISVQNINFIVEKSKKSRITLKNELEKISIYYNKNKSIKFEDIVKLVNSSENHSISELADKLLLNNKKETINIVNENISNSDDNILIIKMILFKVKRLKKIKKKILKEKNQDQVISSFRPLIFWKDKTIIKEQLKVMNLNEINIFIKKLNNLELLVKKNINLSNILTNNFIIEKINPSNNLV